MGRKIPENEAMRKGKEIHDFLSKNNKDYPTIKDFIMPQVNFDEKVKISKKINEKYEVFGYVDGTDSLDFKNSILEIKTGTKFWSILDFRKSMQVKLYGAITDAKKIVCLTTLSDQSLWEMQPPKDYEIEYTTEMKAEAIRWVQNAIGLFERGNFKGGLDENGKCNIWCPYGENCYFK